MPGPIVLEYGSGLSRGIEQAGSAIAQAMGVRNERKRELEERKQSGTILNEVLGKLPPDATTQQYQGAISELYQKGVSPELIKQTIELYKPVIQQREEMSSFNKMFGGGQGVQQPIGSSSMTFGAEGPLASAMQQPQQKQSPISIIKSGQNTTNPMQAMAGMGDISALGDADLLKLASMPNPIANKVAKTEIEMRKLNQQKFNDERAFNAKGADEAANEAEKLRSSIQSREMASTLARQAIETGETGPLSWANIAKRAGVPELMNQAGTQLTQAGKEFFFGNMQKVSAKAQNQWLEQRITQLFSEVGDPKISALTKQAMIEGETDVSKAYLAAYDKLAAQDIENFGYVKKDIQARAFKEAEPQTKEIMNKVSYQTRSLYEAEKGAKWIQEQVAKRVKVPNGTVLTRKMMKAFANEYVGDYKKALTNAAKLGYTIPTREQANIWGMMENENG